jgi:UDP-N-acetylglucosamine 2-epimerase (non-hydrolysing)
MKIIVIVGARPNFMKVAPIMRAIASHNASMQPSRVEFDKSPIHAVLVHTGQHYDARMSDSFFSDLNLPAPSVFLGVGSGSHAEQTAEIMRRFERVVIDENPDVVLVVGDVNSTLACALVAAKMASTKERVRPVIVHVEAGLRSFDRTMPEEINRILTDHLSDLLFVTEQSGTENLQREGIAANRVFLVGNTMIDSLLTFKEKADASTILSSLGLGADKSIELYALLTLHRPANVDERKPLLEILEGLVPLTNSHQIIFPAHPRTQKQINSLGLESYFQFELSASRESANPRKVPQQRVPRQRPIRLIEPLGYLDFVCLMKNASLVVTDSGGIQEETTCLQIPCVTVRENTERSVTLHTGTNILAGTTRDGIRKAVAKQLAEPQIGRIPDNVGWQSRRANHRNNRRLHEHAGHRGATRSPQCDFKH